MIIVTNLLDAQQYTKSDLAQIHRARWNNELAVLEAVRNRQGTVPEPIRVDNGSEYILKLLDRKAYFN